MKTCVYEMLIYLAWRIDLSNIVTESRYSKILQQEFEDMRILHKCLKIKRKKYGKYIKYCL